MTEWGLSNKALWDVRFEEIDFDKHVRFVIEKVFNHGTWSDQVAIMNFYGLEKIKEEALEISYLRPTVVSYLSALLKVPKSAFKCYMSKQFQQIPWNS
jgi:hypothetical protein